MGQSCARAPGLEAPDVHLAARRRCPPASQYAQPRAHRTQTRATIWISYALLYELLVPIYAYLNLNLNLNRHSRFPCSENRCHLHCFWRWRQRAFISVHQEQHLCWRFWSSLWTPWSHAVGALHQLDHLLEQGAFHFFPTRY